MKLITTRFRYQESKTKGLELYKYLTGFKDAVEVDNWREVVVTEEEYLKHYHLFTEILYLRVI